MACQKGHASSHTYISDMFMLLHVSCTNTLNVQSEYLLFRQRSTSQSSHSATRAEHSWRHLQAKLVQLIRLAIFQKPNATEPLLWVVVCQWEVMWYSEFGWMMSNVVDARREGREVPESALSFTPFGRLGIREIWNRSICMENGQIDTDNCTRQRENMISHAVRVVRAVTNWTWNVLFIFFSILILHVEEDTLSSLLGDKV